MPNQVGPLNSFSSKSAANAMQFVTGIALRKVVLHKSSLVFYMMPHASATYKIQPLFHDFARLRVASGCVAVMIIALAIRLVRMAIIPPALVFKEHIDESHSVLLFIDPCSTRSRRAYNKRINL